MHLAQTDLLQSEYFVFVKSVKEIHCSETEKHQCKGSAKTVNIIHCAHYNPYQILYYTVRTVLKWCVGHRPKHRFSTVLTV